MRLRKPLSLLSISSLAIAVLAAQTPVDPDWQTAAGGQAAFDVASVKLAKAPEFHSWLRFLYGGDAKPPGGHFSATASLTLYILFAYKLAPFEASDLFEKIPKWANDNYTIAANAGGNPTKDQMRLMMQSLLADRFKLRVHFENREAPVLVLALVNPGKLGPKLRPHSEGPPCADSLDDDPLTPLPAPQPGAAWPPECGTTAQRGTRDGTWLGSRNASMGWIARALFNPQFGIDKPIVDQTGLPGRFDFILELPPGMITLGPKTPNPDDPPPEPIFLKALREQLGLKLVRSRGEVRTLILDHVEQPSQN